MGNELAKIIRADKNRLTIAHRQLESGGIKALVTPPTEGKTRPVATVLNKIEHKQALLGAIAAALNNAHRDLLGYVSNTPQNEFDQELKR